MTGKKYPKPDKKEDDRINALAFAIINGSNMIGHSITEKIYPRPDRRIPCESWIA